MVQRVRLTAPTLFAIATVFGLSSTAQSYWLHSLSGDGSGASVGHLLALNLVYWYVPALLAPSIMRFARHDRVRRARWPAQAAVHTVGGLTYAATHTAIMILTRAIIHAITQSNRSIHLWDFAQAELLRQLDWLLMTYLFLIGLAHAFAYREEVEASAVTTARLETRLVEAQLQALQRQLQPHFLFNALNGIASQVHTDPDAADQMLEQLGDLLRTTLHTSGRQEVPLRDELEVLRKYLDIEQTRFGDRLHVRMHVAAETLDALVPSLLLQPLVENSIRHGIAPRSRPGWVEVHAIREGSSLAIQVRDSGDGPSVEQATELNQGIGLENTRARLEHLYRSASRFVFSSLDGHFCVTIHIPFQVAPAGAGPAGQIA